MEPQTIPMFSVIIPTYNRPGLLAEAVESVLSQSVDDLECIVVDDASPEPVVAPEDPRVRVIRRRTNGGEPAARNTGLKTARGRWLAFLDDDDYYTRDRLAHAVEGLKTAPATICWRSGTDGARSGNRFLGGEVHDSILNGMTPQIGQIAIQRHRAPFFDERFAALTDVDWCLRMSRGTPVSTVPRTGLIYRTHDGERNRNGLAERVRCSLLLLEVHSDYFATHPQAASFRWKRIGLMAQRLGDHSQARSAFAQSMKLQPTPRTAFHFGRSLRLSSSRSGSVI
jgi:glycosyltransferase involved in cell wall biosynthesis